MKPNNKMKEITIIIKPKLTWRKENDILIGSSVNTPDCFRLWKEGGGLKFHLIAGLTLGRNSETQLNFLTLKTAKAVAELIYRG